MHSTWNIGDLIQNRWEVHRVLRGGMGIVYVVFDRKWHEAFAAKSFQDEVFERNPAAKAMFEREAMAWINLDLHPNIAQARFLQVIDGKPYLFLEYVAGGDLSKWIGTPFLVEDSVLSLRLAVQFCDGMRHVTSKGIKVHRDIKPQNCLLTHDGVLKITDFGLAKIWDNSSEDSRRKHSPLSSTDLSQTGSAAGTCTHMAPEQFLDSKNVNLCADIYSFGVMLFQMVVGTLPFVGKNFEEFALQHLRASPHLEAVQHKEIRQVIQKCLRKDPSTRFQNFDELRASLAAIYKRETGSAPPSPAVGEELSAYHLVNKGKSIGDLGHLEDSLGCFDEAIKLSPSLAEAWYNKAASLIEIGRYSSALECLERTTTLKPSLAFAWSAKGEALLQLGRPLEAVQALEKACALNPREPVSWYKIGCVFASLAKHSEAVSAYKKAVRLSPNLMEAWFNMGHSMGLLGDNNGVICCCENALRIDPEFSRLWILKGLALRSLERHENALECFKQAGRLGDPTAARHIASCREQLEHPDAEAYFRRGSEFQQEGSLAEAVRCYQMGLNIDPSNVIIWNNLGAAYLGLKQGEEAARCFEKIISIHPRDADAWQNKGLALFSAGKHSEAILCIQESKKLGG